MSKRALTRSVDLLLLIGVAIVLWRGFVSWGAEDAGEPMTPVLKVGDTLSLPGIEWSSSQRTVVLFVRSTCPACNRSSPFYQELSNEVASSRGSARLVALSPEPVDTLRAWLNDKAIIPHGAFTTANPLALGFVLQPTLLIVDSKGIVTDTALRSLAPDERVHLLGRLHGEGEPFDNSMHPKEIGPTDLAGAGPASRTLLDVRPRDLFSKRKFLASVNIPANELAERAKSELPTHVPIVIDCSDKHVTACRSAGRELRQMGFEDVSVLFP